MSSLRAFLYFKTKPRKTKRKQKHPCLGSLRSQRIWIRLVYWAQRDQSQQGHPGVSHGDDPSLVLPAAGSGLRSPRHCGPRIPGAAPPSSLPSLSPSRPLRSV